MLTTDTALHLSPDLALPTETVTETVAVFGRRGAGKTATAAVLVEEMLTAGAQTVIVDPLDAWWGLRLDADGHRAGLPIVVLGGAHGDLPLEATAGAAVADVVVEERLSVVLSLRHLSKTQQRQVVMDFCERLYARKGPEEYRTPLCLVIDEIDLFAPQRVYAGQERLLGAIDDIARRGRMSGLGLIGISQRPAVVNADVRSQAEILIVGQLTLRHDQKAIADWVEEHATPEQKRDLLASLPSLPVGTFWLCSPGWLQLFARVQVRRRRSFDSSATPKVGAAGSPGAARPEPMALAPGCAPVDLAALRERLAGALERTTVDDPAALRRQIALLERQLQERPAAVETVIERVEVPAISDAVLSASLRLARVFVPLQLEEVAQKTLEAALDAQADTQRFIHDYVAWRKTQGIRNLWARTLWPEWGLRSAQLNDKYRELGRLMRDDLDKIEHLPLEGPSLPQPSLLSPGQQP